VTRKSPRRLIPTAALAAGVLLVLAAPAHAYVGPGAGFVLAPLFLGLLAGLLAVLGVIALPFVLLWNLLFGRRPPRGRAKRVVVVGIDGMDPVLTRRYMAKGLLPNLASLKADGHFGPLEISVPSISPSSWSSFQTGADASRHRIYDFITRDPCSCAPVLSSVRVEAPKRTLRIGKWRLPLGRPRVIGLRRSRAFWHALSDEAVPSTVLRVPITFPAEKFRGAMLSGMCVPDLKGTQGVFTFFTTGEKTLSGEGGEVVRVRLDGDTVRGRLAGPRNALREGAGDLTIPFTVRIDRKARRARLVIGGETLDLAERELSPWVPLRFKAAPLVAVHAIARFVVTSLDPEFGLYVTPLMIDPERPALPISHPLNYSVWLAKKLGPFATLGLAEDTSALNEGITDEETFLAQAMAHQEEREKQLFATLATTRKGCVTVVFDAADRVQHMFFRTLDPTHPANAGRETERYRNVIRDLYVRFDDLVGKVRAKLRKGDALIVLSDHGFCPFRRGVNLNAFLHREGWLHLQEGADGSGAWFNGVDWSRTKAFALGLTGMFLNRAGREGRGIVTPEEAPALRREIAEKLEALRDPADGARVVRKAYDAAEIYDGPYRDEAPDLLIGFSRGYRHSWKGATGVTREEVLTDNVKPWSGDHCVDPKVVPGVFFTDFRLAPGLPRMTDVAPTILDLLGVAKPKHMTGHSLLPAAEGEVKP
jgi:predicted AlkP superfamily phosphohydrolase/phosphomutase